MEGNQKLKMKSIIISCITVITAASCTLTGTLYETLPEIPEGAKITLTTNKMGEVTLGIAGSGAVTINWDDGSPAEQLMLSGENVNFRRSYSHTIPRTITITGKDVTRLNCSGNQVQNLDISENTKLTHLLCSANQLEGVLDLSANTLLASLICDNNQLTGIKVSGCRALTSLNCAANFITSLEMSSNIALVTLACNNNKMNAEALSALLLTLHSYPLSGKSVFIAGNPGTGACQNKDVAITRGWEVID